MSENNDKKNIPAQDDQDFIEGHDPLAQSLDENFPEDIHRDMEDYEYPADDVIEMEAEPIEGEHLEFDAEEDFTDDDEWSEDFDDDDFAAGNMDDVYQDDGGMGNKGGKNWFNIAIFGVLGVVACGLMYSYLPGIFGFGGADQPTPRPQQNASIQSNSNMPSMDTAENRNGLAQQALSEDAVLIQEAGGLLTNPDLLGSGSESLDRADPDAEGNAVFEALNNTPQMAESEINDIFSALEEQNNPAPEPQADVEPQPEPEEVGFQNLPEASDGNIAGDEQDDPNFGNIFENIPRAPETETAANTEADDVEITALDEFELADDANTATETGLTSLGTNATRQADETGDETNAQDTVADENAPVISAEAPAQPATTSTAQQTQTAPAEELATVNNQINDITARLDSLSQRIEMIANQSQTAQPQSTSDVSELKDTIAALEKRISVLSKQQQESTSPASRPAAPAPTRTTTRSAPKAVTPAPAPAPSWTLRGASPGQAYVAERGTQNLRNVAVGDRLAGIGTINSIAQENGQWVVRGSSGTIRQ